MVVQAQRMIQEYGPPNKFSKSYKIIDLSINTTIATSFKEIVNCLNINIFINK